MKLASWLVTVAVLGSLFVGASLMRPVERRSAQADEAAGAGRAAFGSSKGSDRARPFETRIAPLLARHCLECHDSGTKKGGLDLSRKAAASRGGENGVVIVPGQAAKSLLWQYVESDAMPPNREPLSREEKESLRQWIEGGAAWSLETIDPAAYPDRRAESAWMQRLTVPEYIETVRRAVGIDIEDDARRLLPADLRADGFSNTAYSQNVDLEHVKAYAELAKIIVSRMDVTAFASRFTKRQGLDDESMRELIAGMGKWLLRGPLDDREIEAYLIIPAAVAKERGTFAEAAGYLIEAMLQSPRFIYRLERQRGDGAVRRVGGYELASRLSYILWGGPPDAELMRAAGAGELSDRARVAAQVERMLKDPRAVEHSARFIHEWMDLDRLSALRPDPGQYPDWDPQLAADMREETLAFFKYVAWEQKRPLSELMNAQVTFATPRLADHYGLTREQAVSTPEGHGTKVRGIGRRSPERVTAGLQALYTFREGRGATVRDISRAGEPLNLKVENAAAVRWSDEGLTIAAPTLIATTAPPRRLVEAVKRSKALTLEAWVTPANASQAGPARIVTLSANTGVRNLTLGQEKDRFDVRLRTTKTDGNGLPSLAGPSRSAQARLTHVVYTRDPAGKARLYVDGEERGSRETGGDLSNWDGGFQLALANELTKDRPWQGMLHLVAIYDRALSADEVQRNHSAGARDEGTDEESSALQALYTFREGRGKTVHDTSGAGEPLDLQIENSAAVAWSEAGLTVKGPTLIAAGKPPQRLIDAVKRSKAVTLEAWITPADTRQSGPARILTLSSGVSQRNFTLGQDKDKYEVRFRAKETDPNGLPGVTSPAGSVAARLTHVVYTRDTAGRARLYVNGEEHKARDAVGDLANWDGNFRLALANETTKDRPWRGTYHRIAIYSRALAPDEVRSPGSALSRYDLASVPGRGGLLTQGSVLTIGGDHASMVTRGLFILHDLLHSRVGNPPPCVDTTPVPTKPGLTQRGIALRRIADASCGGCHAKFEPLAFGLEKFDGVGAYREVDQHGNRLRDDGEVLFPGAERPTAYRSAEEFMDLLAGSDRVRRGITRKVTQFALGRPLVRADEPIIEQIHKTAQQNGGTYASLITAIVMSDLVQTTRTEPK